RVLEKISRDPSLSDSPRLRYEAERELEIEQESLYRTIPPGGAKAYLFIGLADARSPGANPRVTLRYRVNAGSNDPTAIYRVRFYINQVLFERQVALAASQTLLFDKRLIDEDGTVTLVVENDRENPRELAFPPDGLEVLYSSGDYATNFVRIMFVMWVKLGFTAAVAIAASTFLSFPVACLVAMTVLFAAESAGYLKESLDYYVSMTKDGIDYVALVVRVIAVPISRVFQVYAELKPTAKLVDGRLLGWGPLLSSSLVLIAWAAAVLGLGWAIFRQRELATYSGR
ncbi:MAG: hypothetical protein SFZ24_12925, partial [Planctomycetota bacterium]|nr:hypothetical protein [Planctomycetota bacterium]